MLRRLPMALACVLALGAIALIVVGSRFGVIAGILLLGLAVSVALIKRSPDPVARSHDDERR